MLRQIRKTLKNHPLEVAKKYVETYSSSNAAARDPEEKGKTDQYTTNILQDKLTHTKITKEKENRVNRTTDGPRMT